MPRLATDTPAPDDNLPPAPTHETHEPAPDAAGANQTAQTVQRVRDLILTGDIEPGSRLTELGLVERRGETVKVVVVLKAAHKGQGQRAGHHQLGPRPHGVEIVDALPRSGTGKIQWRQLQEQQAQG